MTDVDEINEVTISEAARLTGTTYRQVDYYLRTGILTPTNNGSIRPGSGYPRALTARDVDALRVLGRLMLLRGRFNHYGLLNRYTAITRHVQEYGPTGTFELIPGITVDIARLVSDVSA